MSLLVLVAHSGRTLQLDVQPTTRVDAVQHALVSFTGIPVADQIAMYQGARLDQAKPLGAYRLPVDPNVAALEDHPVFLYCRSYLKPGAALPPPEALPPLHVQVPPLAEVNLTHPLHSAPSPLVRALPDYERHFQHHLATTRAYWEVAQARLQRCRQLLSEQEVQARAADAARANVEAHYNHILNSYQSFLDKYNAQHAAHAALLSTFPADLAALEAIELHPALQQPPQQPAQQPLQQQQPLPAQLSHHDGSLPAQSWASLQQQQQQHGVGGGGVLPPVAAAPRRLADLYPVQRLREWGETCSRSHASFGGKVSELEALFQLLRKDVEGLFMQAPSVDLDALGRQMAEHEALLDEHSSMVQVLSKDLRTVRTLVEDVVRQLGSAAGGGGGAAAGGGGSAPGLRQGALHDAAAAMEAIHETHRNRVLPRLAQLDGQLAAFAARVEASKVAMSRDVLQQLQRISGQQSRIRDMKNKLAAFYEVLGRQDAAFGELRAVHRLPSAYRALLAEAVRRSAWHELYCGQAGRLAEHMARFRDKEAGRRTAFTSQVSRYMPSDLLARAGLASEPPHCQVTVPSPEVPVIGVSMADLQRLSYLDERVLAASTAMRASAAAASHHHHHHHHHPPHRTASIADPQASASHQHHHHQHHHHQHHHHQQQAQTASRLGPAASMAFPGTTAVLDADPPAPTDSSKALEMENARLRAELANYIAAACIRELTSTTTSSAGGVGEAQQPVAAAAAAEAAAPAQAAAAAAAEPGGTGATAPAGRAARGSGGGGASPPSAAAAGGPSAAGSPQQPRRDPAELVAAMQRALGMKDDLIRHQQREMGALAARAAAYEERIRALEELLTQRATGGDGASGLAASGPQANAGGSDGHGGAVTEAAASAHADREETGQLDAGGLATEAATPPAGPAETVPAHPNVPAAVADVGALVEAAQEPSVGGGAGGGPDDGPTATGAASGGLTAGSVAGTAVSGPAASQREAAHVAAPVSALRIELGSAAAAGPALASPLSPFSLEAVQLASTAEQEQQERHQQQHQEHATGTDVPGYVDQEAEGPAAAGSSAGGLQGRRGHAPIGAARGSEDAGASAAVAAGVLYGGRVGSGSQPRRGSSGPQAIPQAAGGGSGGSGLRRGGGAAAGDEEAAAVPYEARVPIAIGSLPFATSLPVGSSLASRLASSPSGGIGLGLALGFGLATLAEGARLGTAPGGEGPDVPLRHSDSSSSSSSGDSGRSSGSSSTGGDRGSRRVSYDGEEGGDGGRLQERGSGGGSGSGLLQRSSGGVSSAGLQFQPSWSAPVSGENATGPDTGPSGSSTHADLNPAGVAAGVGSLDGLAALQAVCPRDGTEPAVARQGAAAADEDDDEVAGDAAVESRLEGTVGEGTAGEEAPVAEPCAATGAEGGAAAAPVIVDASGRGGVASVEGAPGDTTASRSHSDDGKMDDEGDDDNDGVHGDDVPDIDEVFDSDGAWEVASTAAAAGSVAVAAAASVAVATDAGTTDAPPSGDVGDTVPVTSASTAVGQEQGLTGSGRAAGAATPPLEASAGYESVGSVISDADW